jgi:hypothetical protein
MASTSDRHYAAGMSAFTDRCANAIHDAARATTTTPRWLKQQRNQARQERTLANRAGQGLLTLIIFGPIIYLLLPAIAIIVTETVIVAWIALLAVLWLAGTAIDSITGRRRRHHTAAN